MSGQESVLQTAEFVVLVGKYKELGVEFSVEFL